MELRMKRQTTATETESETNVSAALLSLFRISATLSKRSNVSRKYLIFINRQCVSKLKFDTTHLVAFASSTLIRSGFVVKASTALILGWARSNSRLVRGIS
jgi:hypothetical protein